MIVCDKCQKLGSPSFACWIALIKDEDKKGKASSREVKRLPIDLCENCITDTITLLGNTIKNMRAKDVK